MEETYMAGLFEKEKLTENLYVFKQIGVITNAYIDITDELEELTYYDESGKKVVIQSLECPYFLISDETCCYGYAVQLSFLKEKYQTENTTELALKYLDDLMDVLTIGYYDEETDSIKILVSNGKIFKDIKDTDDLFKKFSVSYDSNIGDNVVINVKDLKAAKNLLEEKKYDFLTERLNKVIGAVTDSIESLKEKEAAKEKTEKKQKAEELNEVLNELDNLTGLDNIKREVIKLQKYLSFREKVKENLKLNDPNLHMFFTGNPGTGKTTVARIIGKLYHSMGYLSSDSFAEITPRELIAGYVGQTAIKTAKFIKEHKGGVIFIDEAYVFSSDAQDFADEALVEILKELEKKETVFIFAGYKDEMKKFMELNPGLSSRIGYYLEYEDYNVEQLLEIFIKKAENMGFKVEEELKEKIKKQVNIAKESKNFGNGRYIDKLLEKIILEHSSNTEKETDVEILKTLTSKDLTQDVLDSLLFKQKVKKLGF